MLKVDKLVSIGWGKGRRRNVTVLREHYLRDDIACRYQHCPICNNATSNTLLLGNANHYVIPDGETLCQYQEIFEHPNLTGIILTQTAANTVRDDVGRRSYNNLIKTMADSRKNSVVFDNEHQMECYSTRQSNETMKAWRKRLHLSAIVWFVNHLEMAGASHIKLVIVTEDTTDYNIQLNSRGCYGNIEVTPLSIYISSEWCYHINSIGGLYESLMAARQNKLDVQKTDEGFTEYIPLEDIKSGVIEGKYITGSLRVSRYHPRNEAFVTSHEVVSFSDYDVLEESSISDILIPGISLRNRAIDGDTVAIQLLPRNLWRGTSKALPSGTASSHDQSCDKMVALPTGRVVAVINRNPRNIVATFPEDGHYSSGKKDRILTIPYDHRLPKVRISTSLASQLQNHRIVVRIDQWDITSQYPDGHYVRTIGPIGDIETETQAILIENQLSCDNFGPLIMSEQPNGADWTVSPEEVSQRSDLRESHLVFSIDPKGCEDVDDTLSVRTLKNGNIEFGVHIADVSYFVKPGSHTDREARERSTTIYLADRRNDMLPTVLSSNLCSLHSNVDRYTVSVIWRLSPQYEVLKVWYGRTIIRSAYELAYEVAQDIYDGKDKADIIGNIKEFRDASLTQHEITERLDLLSKAVKQLVDIARVLKGRRDLKGALDLEAVEVKVQLGDEKSVENLIPKQPLEMHETVAECMIFANHWLARKLYESLPSRALLRHHPTPIETRFSPLVTAAAAKGHSIDCSSNLGVAKSLNRATDPKDFEYNKILRMIATQAMPQANYFSTGSLEKDQFHHYGLALDLYTHFTSPIRRYADLIVHRQLLEALNVDNLGDNLEENLGVIGDRELSELCSHMNKKKRSAALAQLASTSLFQALYFLHEEDTTRNRAEAIVYNIRANGILAYIPRYGIKGPVYLKDKNGLVLTPSKDDDHLLTSTDGTISYTDHYITVIHPYGKYTLKLFDHILVKIRVDHGRTHPYSFSLELFSCTPLPITNERVHSSIIRPELVKVVQSEVTCDHHDNTNISGDVYNEYNTNNNSLYCLIQNMKRIGMSDMR